MRLGLLTKEQCEKARQWRNQSPETLRTPYPLTAEMQEAFYREHVCNPHSPHKYWAVLGVPPGTVVCVPHGSLEKMSETLAKKAEAEAEHFLGMGGLTYISIENRSAEISLILEPSVRGRGLGQEVADLLLDEGFGKLNLDVIYGEVYQSNPTGIAFWTKFAAERNASTCVLPARRYWNGQYWDAFYFAIRRGKSASTCPRI